MLLRQKPSNPQLYYITYNTESQELQQHGFIPKYFWEDKFYFTKTEKLINFLEKL